MEQFKKKFLEEATDLINELEKALLSLDSSKNDKNLLEQIFRVMHSLKGGSAMFGFDKIDAFTHHLESIYDLVRNGKKEISEELLNVTFESVDHLKMLLDEDNYDNENFIKKHAEMLEKVIKLSESKAKVEKNIIDEKPKIIIEENNNLYKTYYIYFKPNQDIFKSGTNPIYIIDDIFLLGNTKVYARIQNIPKIEIIDTSVCYTEWEFITTTDKGVDAIKDIFIFVDNDCEIEIHELAGTNLFLNNETINNLDELFNSANKINIKDIQSIISKTDKKNIEKEDKRSLVEKVKKASIDAVSSKENRISSLRVASDKLDDLIDWVSELVTIQARLSLYVENNSNTELDAIVEEVEKISRRLRDNVFSIRLIPIENMITRFQRLVRELSHELNKDIEFHSEGVETELDKSIIESLVDPIMHILRNCIDHGIESSEERIKKGKPKHGKILFKAFHSGINVFIQVSDDGKGIDVNEIKKHAIQKDLISSDTTMSNKEILELLFLPGFSTASSITKVSGRGVGMDVVKRKISELRGEVDIESKINVGTTITIKLPITLSIIDGLLVKIGTTNFVIPLSSVNKCIEFNHEKLMNTVNNMIFIGDTHIPFLYLRNHFNITVPPPEIEKVIVVQFNDSRIGLSVDYIIGEYQAVLKPLGKLFKDQDIISGATILGDGTVALVVDTNRIITQYTQKQ